MIHQHVWEVVPFFGFCTHRRIENLRTSPMKSSIFDIGICFPIEVPTIESKFPMSNVRQHHDNGVDQVSSCVKSFEEVPLTLGGCKVMR